MELVMKIAFAAIVMLLTLTLVVTLNAQSENNSSDELQKFERQWAAAAVKQDTKLIESLWADDFELTNPGGQMAPKALIIEKIKDGSFKIESFDYTSMKVRTYGDTAVITGRLTIKGSWEGSDVGGEYAFTDTFVKLAGKWREVASQVTRVEN